MFDLTSSKLLILGVVALIVVGPKELPFLLRTIGKYVSMIRRQANEFRAQFDEAMREAELDSIRKDVENVARDAENSLKDATSSVDREIHDSQRAIEDAGKVDAPPTAADPVPTPVHTYDPLNGLDTGTPAAPEHAAAPVVEHAPAVPISVLLPEFAPVAAHPVVPAELSPAMNKPVLAKTGT
jgi:sec-independent protein translocase protein TatB